MGDFNLNLLNIDTHRPTDDFINMMFSNSLCPLISKPTRITNQTATLIDNIFSNNVEPNAFLHGIFFTDISDHLPIFCIDFSSKIHSQPKHITYRDYSQRNLSRFINDINIVNWLDVLNSDEPQDAYTKFHNKFTHVYSSCFPLKRCTSNYKNKKPWLTRALKNSIKTKNKLYILSKKCPSAANTNSYKDYRNKLQSIKIM